MATERLTAPAAPVEAQRVFHVERLPLVLRYADWLADGGTVRGLIGPREVPRLWGRHLLNCGMLADAIASGSSVVDVGSGAGLPGLVLAIARPDLTVTLVEPLLRRTTFLSEVVADLELDNVEVVRGRADALHRRRTFDAVTSRAVTALPTLLEWSMPLVAPAGSLVAMKGASAAEEIAVAGDVLRRLGCADPVIEVYGAGIVDPPTTVVRVSWADPRQVGSGGHARALAGGRQSSTKQGGRRR